MSKLGRNQLCACGSGKKFKKCCGSAHPLERPREEGPVPPGSGILFGNTSTFLISLLDSFARSSTTKSYRIAPISEFDALTHVAERNRIYWQEMLYRAHFAGSTALLRLYEWVVGAQRAYADSNVLVLAAALRGFVEAGTDTFDALSDAASTFADCHSIIRSAIAGKLDDVTALLPELENSLIHFAYARKLTPDAGPRLHQAKTARDYLSVVTESFPEVVDVYGLLCEYSHPAERTVFRFAARMNDPTMLTFDPHAGAEQIHELQRVSVTIGERLMPLCVPPCFMVLKVLNAFGLDEVYTPWADGLALDFSEIWRGIDRRLHDPSPPRTATDIERGKIVSDLLSAYEPLGAVKRKKD